MTDSWDEQYWGLEVCMEIPNRGELAKREQRTFPLLVEHRMSTIGICKSLSVLGLLVSCRTYFSCVSAAELSQPQVLLHLASSRLVWLRFRHSPIFLTEYSCSGRICWNLHIPTSRDCQIGLLVCSTIEHGLESQQWRSSAEDAFGAVNAWCHRQ